MPSLTILPLEKTIELEKGETIRDALLRFDIEIENPCNGEGLCGQCGVVVENPDDVPETPHKCISPSQTKEGFRLSCTTIPHRDMTIHLPPEVYQDTLRILESDGFSHLDEIDIDDDRILDSEPIEELPVKPAVTVHQEETGEYHLHYKDHEKVKRIENWLESYSRKGLAIDLGTTTLVASLFCLDTGRELATASLLNPQVRYGHDVMTRIQMGSELDGLEELALTVREGLNQLVKMCCKESGSSPEEILDVVLGGNTTMLQLAAQIDPEPLGRYPFNVGIRGGQSYRAKRFGLEINPVARVYVPYITYAFVGSDITAGLLCIQEFFKEDSSILFIDIGTNGEIGLSYKSQWMVTSTAAGPAFEGMGISNGMRALNGAIDASVIRDNDIHLKTIGDAPPIGICGSGIIELVDSMLRLGIIDSSGRMTIPELDGPLGQTMNARFTKIDGILSYKLANDVYFTQEDVRQVQLAKSAIRTVIDMFLEETGGDSFDKIIIAGGFGFALDPESLEAIGIIPPGMADRVYFAGNTSLQGCSRLILNSPERKEIEELMSEVKHVLLVEHPDYMESYIGNMEFPEKTVGLAFKKIAQKSCVLIACKSIRPEIDKILHDNPDDDIEVRYIEQNLHLTPDRLKDRLQEEINKVGEYASRIVLGYGLCSNGVVGLEAPSQGLIIPRVHDCITLFLGSREAYNTLFRKRPGTYYLTPGWIQEEKDPLGFMVNDYTPRMGKKEAEEGLHEEFEHYTHITLIDTGVRNVVPLRKRAQENADFLEKKYEEIKGSPDYYNKILFGPYDSDDFIIVEPGGKISQDSFFDE